MTTADDLRIEQEQIKILENELSNGGYTLSLEDILGDVGTMKNSMEGVDMEEWIFKSSYLEYSNNKASVKQNVDTESALFACCPPNTILESILSVWKDKTDFPLELPFFIFLVYFGLFLNIKKKGVIKADSTSIERSWKYLNFNLMIIANSGDGKSQTQTFMSDLFNNLLRDGGELPVLGQAKSERAYCEGIQKIGEIGLLNIDEYGQFMLNQNDAENQNIIRLFLRLYDGTVDYKTKDDTFDLKNLKWSVLTAMTPTSMDKKFTEEVMNNGAGNRTLIVFGNERKISKASSKHWNSFNKIQDELNTLVENTTLLDEYYISKEAEDAYEQSFNLMCKINVPKGYVRRTLDQSYKWALLMKIICGKGHTVQIEAEYMGWAGRISALLLSNVIRLIEISKGQELNTKVERIEKWLKDKDAENNIVTLRDLAQSKRISKTSEGKELLEILGWGIGQKGVLFRKYK